MVSITAIQWFKDCKTFFMHYNFLSVKEILQFFEETNVIACVLEVYSKPVLFTVNTSIMYGQLHVAVLFTRVAND